MNGARSQLRVIWPVLPWAIAILTACHGQAAPSASDDRTRVNEEHVMIYQDAPANSPIAGIEVENGTPSKNTFRADARVLELSVLGDLNRPTVCAIVIERVRETKPLQYPFGNVFGTNAAIERYSTIPCSPTPDSTKVTLPQGPIALTGHVEYAIHGELATYDWTYHIDHIVRAPRIAQFDPPDAFTRPAKSP